MNKLDVRRFSIATTVAKQLASNQVANVSVQNGPEPHLPRCFFHKQQAILDGDGRSLEEHNSPSSPQQVAFRGPLKRRLIESICSVSARRTSQRSGDSATLRRLWRLGELTWRRLHLAEVSVFGGKRPSISQDSSLLGNQCMASARARATCGWSSLHFGVEPSPRCIALVFGNWSDRRFSEPRTPALST